MKTQTKLIYNKFDEDDRLIYTFENFINKIITDDKYNIVSIIGTKYSWWWVIQWGYRFIRSFNFS